MGKQAKNTRLRVHATSLSTPKAPRGAGKVRIVGGMWKRSALEVASRDGLRPTPERIRETVYDWLVHLWGGLDGKRVCDLFAGSGAMGFEAASRGAAAVDWVDVERVNTINITRTLERLGAPSGMKAHRADAFTFLASGGEDYDLVLIDPPFSRDWQAKAAGAALGRLAPEGLLYVESPERALDEALVESLGLEPVRRATAGRVVCELFARKGSVMATMKKIKEKKQK